MGLFLWGPYVRMNHLVLLLTKGRITEEEKDCVKSYATGSALLSAGVLTFLVIHRQMIIASRPGVPFALYNYKKERSGSSGIGLIHHFPLLPTILHLSPKSQSNSIVPPIFYYHRFPRVL
jgi:hypothetical protein